MNAFGRDKRESFGQIEPGLGPKIGERTDTGSVVFGPAFFQNQMEQLMIFFHLKRELSADYTDYADFSTVGKRSRPPGSWILAPDSSSLSAAKDDSPGFQPWVIERFVTITFGMEREN